MTRSMTGYAEARGEGAGHEWRWELRSVNGRGLDLRLRLPDWVEGLEPAVRSAVGGAASRGSLTLSLRIAPADREASRALDDAALAGAAAMLIEVERTAREMDLALAPPTAAQVLGIPGVVRDARRETDSAGLREALLADLRPVLGQWDAARAAEGARLAEVLAGQLEEIAALVGEARAAARDREPEQAEALRRAIARVLGEASVDPDRLAQELALIAVRTDVAEEVDRLDAHVAAARDLLAADGPVGRRLDFLAQEFAREANTICSKAQSGGLTRIGLDLKAVIDRMREQVQNLE